MYLRYLLALLAFFEFHEALRWVEDPVAQEKKLAGLLVASGCATSTACGSDGVCAAYGRAMAWALIGLGLMRVMCALGTGVEVWFMGVASHIVETCFFWSEYVAVSSARVAVLPSPWKRTATLFAALTRPPYGTFHLALIGPPAITFWLLLSFKDFEAVAACCTSRNGLMELGGQLTERFDGVSVGGGAARPHAKRA